MPESLYRPLHYCVGIANDPQPEDKLRFFDTLEEAIEKAKLTSEICFNSPIAVWNQHDEIVHLFLCSQQFRPV